MKIPIPNIEENKLDPSYRYMRDSVNIIREGQFNIVDNIELIAKQLNVSLIELQKFLKSKLGQQVIIKNNKFKIKNIPI